MEDLIWPTVVLLIVIAGLFIFKTPIGAKINELRSVQRNGNKFKIFFDIQEQQEKKTIEAMPNDQEEIITIEDVSQALRKIPDLDSKDIDKYSRQAHSYFLGNGIQWKHQLDELVTSSSILDALRKIYIEELFRPEDKPLDPIAISTWGSKLFMHGTEEVVLSAIREELKRFPEYRQKHS